MTIKRFSKFLLMFLLSIGLTSQLLAQKTFELRSGVVIDPGRHLAYVMNTKGGIDAVELDGGALAWSTDQASKPLALIGGRLICQVEPQTVGNELEIAILNVQERGKRVIVNSKRLPSNVRVSISESLNSSYTIYARVRGEAIFMSWKYSFRPIKGTAPPDLNIDRKTREALSAPKIKPSQITGGTIRMELSSGAMSFAKKEDVPVALAPLSIDIAANERLAGVPGRRFIAADSAHILCSERIADDRTWDKYRWTIYERTTGKPVAEIRSYRSRASFFVHGSQVIYETGPYTRRTEKGLVHVPLKIRAVDTKTGRELWSRPIRDTTYRGPYPG